MAILKKDTILYNDLTIPVEINIERRNSVRAAIGKKAAIIRLPVHLPISEREHHIVRMKQWVVEQFSKDARLKQRFTQKTYRQGDTLIVGERTYIVDIQYVNEDVTHKGQLKNGIMQLRINANAADLQSSIATLLSRLAAKDALPQLSRRVHELNHLYFRQPIGTISLKYNHSNWGSCSTSSNLNFSTRLLFAPPSVVDYVIIHELAHLLEMNHSPRFWKLVADAMPDYTTYERWLKANSHLCFF